MGVPVKNLILFERDERDPIHMFVITAPGTPDEEDHRACGEKETAEDQEGDDVHRTSSAVASEWLPAVRQAVCQTSAIELKGIRIAQSTGVISPAKQSARTTTL